MPDILIRGMCAQTSGVSCLLCEQWRGRDNDLINPESAKRCNLWSAAYGREIKTKAYYRCDYSTNIYASERRNTKNDFMISRNKFLNALVLDADGKTGIRGGEQMTETIETNLFDQEEIHPNCTVQILRNSITGEVSVGWWPNEEEGDENS